MHFLPRPAGGIVCLSSCHSVRVLQPPQCLLCGAIAAQLITEPIPHQDAAGSSEWRSGHRTCIDLWRWKLQQRKRDGRPRRRTLLQYETLFYRKIHSFIKKLNRVILYGAIGNLQYLQHIYDYITGFRMSSKY